MQEGLYRLCQLPIPFQYINKLFFNLQSLTDYLWIYILDHDFINKITTPYSSPLPKEKFWIRAYDVEPIINWRRVSLSFQRRCFSISETYGKARLKPICLQKNALFHAKLWSLKIFFIEHASVAWLGIFLQCSLPN